MQGLFTLIVSLKRDM